MNVTEIYNQTSNITQTVFQHKYGYQNSEVLAMVLITAISNFAILPTLVLFYKQRMIFHFFIGLFTFICSFMYHLLDSIAVSKFFLEIGEWHRLDNVGSIQCFMMLMAYLSDLQDLNLETSLNYAALLVCLFAQEADPWNINYTLVPLLTWAIILIIIKIGQGRCPKLNQPNVVFNYFINKKLRKGLFFIVIAFYSFYRGLDDYNDYLRFFHGCWHLNISFSSFYVWQCKLDDFDSFKLKGLLSSQKVKHNYYWPISRTQQQ